MSKKVQIVYDGECPFCDNYCKLVRIKEAAGEVELVDARQQSGIMDEITKAGLDIDDGMVVTIDGEIYYGAEAIHRLSLLSTRSGVFNRLTYHIFKSPKVSKILYPLLRDCRNVALWALGKSRIDNLNTGHKAWIGKKRSKDDA